MRKLAVWFFSPQDSSQAFPIIKWWEARRIPFNVVVGIFGACCFLVFVLSLQWSGHLGPGEDPEEPVVLLVAPIAINFLYTLGWLTELAARALLPGLSPRFSSRLLLLGLTLGLVLLAFPAVFWLGYALLRSVGLVS